MVHTSFNKILSGSLWGILAKVLDALAKFVTIPLLVAFYGKQDYGMIALAFSLNAYLRLMDMGMNIGSIRFFSIWIVNKEYEKIQKVSKSSIVFYGGIGLINALVFVVMAQYSSFFFKLTPEQVDVFKWMMYVLAASTVFNWTSNVISQLLSAHGEMGWINRVTVLSSLFNFITAFVAIKLKLSLPVYFLLYTLSTLMIIPLNIYKLKVYNNISRMSLLLPQWDGKAFKEILGYSVAIFAMGIFQFSADNLRPLLLGKYSSEGISVLTDYRVIQTIAMLIIAFGGVFLDVLLPSASKLYAENDKEKMDRLIYTGTKYITIFLALIVFLLITVSGSLLTLYMGSSYQNLSIWLSIWLVTVLLAMHNAPAASLVLSSGKTRPLVYSSGISCLISLPITVILAPKLNVGAAVIGYLVYTLLQISTYYFYYNPKIIKLNSQLLFFRSFLPGVLCGAIAYVSTFYLDKLFVIKHSLVSIILMSVIFFIIYGGLTILFVLNKEDISFFKRKMSFGKIQSS